MKGCFCHFNGYEVKDAAARSGIAENKAAIDVERQRINQMASLPEGSTSGDAELLDIRIDYMGNIHPSAGEAVRSQVMNIEKRISSENSRNIFNKDAVTAERYLIDGTPSYTSAGLSVSDFVEIEPGKAYVIYGAWNAFTYDENKNMLRATDIQCFIAAENEKYLRITLWDSNIETCLIENSGHLNDYTNHGKKISQDYIAHDVSDINIFKEQYLENGKYLYPTSGNLNNNAEYSTTQLIHGYQGDIFTVNHCFVCCIYNSDYSFSRFVGDGAFRMENDERFFRVSFHEAQFYHASIQKRIGFTEKKEGYIHTTVYVGTGRLFETITAALEEIKDNDEFNRYTLILDAGIYSETITTKNYVDIVGVNKYQCIIDYVCEDESDFVNRSAIFATTFTTLKNITVKTKNSKYPLHCDAAPGFEYRLICENCTFQHNGFDTDIEGTAVGIGLYRGQHVELHNCECIASGGDHGSAAVYCHNWGESEANSGFRSLTLKHCILKNSTYGLRLDAIESDNYQDNQCIYIGNSDESKNGILKNAATKDSWHIFKI